MTGQLIEAPADAAPRAWPDLPERRRGPVIDVLPHVLLAALAVVTVLARPAGGPLTDLVLCALVEGWTLAVFTFRPAWRDRAAPMAVFVGVLVALTAVLVVRHPWFGCFTPALYVYAYRLLRWPGLLVGVAAVAVLAGTAQCYAVDRSTTTGRLVYLAVLAANVLPMCGFGWFARVAGQRDVQRRRALTDLAEANQRLTAALAENAGLHEQVLARAREAGALDERARMAREIHDTLAQGLIGIITQLQAAEQTAPDGVADAGEWHRHVGAATALARESLAEARRSVHALRPEPLRTARLGEALAEVAARWSALNGITARVTTTGTARPLPPEAEVALLRTGQEALANVARHAAATRVGVTLSYLDDGVVLDVRDDGRGFDLAQLEEATRLGAERAGGGGFGLVAMRQRIEGLAGTLHVESEPGGGTGISARVPLTPDTGVTSEVQEARP